MTIHTQPRLATSTEPWKARRSPVPRSAPIRVHATTTLACGWRLVADRRRRARWSYKLGMVAGRLGWRISVL